MVTEKLVPAVSVPECSVVTVNAENGAGRTVMAPLVPDLRLAVAVIVGVSLAL